MAWLHFDRRHLFGCAIALAALAISFSLSLELTEAHSGHDDGRHPASSGAQGSCEDAGLMTVGDAGRCTHGPDPAPPGVDPATVDGPENFSEASFAICDGNGTSGSRVQVLYVHASDQPNRYEDYLDSFRGWASEGDAVYQQSARKMGGMRYIRFVHDANCVISVLSVTVSPAGDDDFWTLSGELWNLGFHNANRKYLVFLDKNHPDWCGQADVFQDDSPDSGNINNNRYGMAVIYNGCWSSNVTISHELGHNFGAVQRSSPNASLWDHCVDEWDVMCYDDGSNMPLRFECEDYADNERLDCNNDDYFSTDPPSGSWLASHWNIADSSWLGSNDARLDLSRESSKYNGWIDVELEGFTPNQTVTLVWPDLSVLVQTTVNGAGTGSARFRTPLAALGTYTVMARDQSGNTATDLLRVIPRINLTEFSGYPADVVRIYFYGFAPDDQVEVKWYAQDGVSFEVLATITIADNGRGTALISVPYTVEIGSHTIRGDVVGEGRSASLSFTVNQTPWQMTLSKSTSKFNGYIVATATGLAPNSAVTLRWPDDTVLAETTSNGSGEATASFLTPLAPLGNYIVRATDEAGTTAIAQLRVIPRILLSEDVGYPGAVVRVYYYGFAPGNQVETKWFNADGTTFTILNTLTIAENGRGSALIQVPDDAAVGTHMVEGDVVGVNRSTSTSFAVLQTPWSIALSKEKSKYNGEIEATLLAFAPNASITLTWPDGTVLDQTTTDGSGNAIGSFRTPLAPIGDYLVRATDSSGNFATTTLRIIPRIKLNETAGLAGDTIRVYFYGFAPGNEVEIRWYELDGETSSLLDTITIADNGRGSKQVVIPDDAAPGDHIIRGKVIGISRSASTSFTVTDPSSAEEPSPTPTATETASPTPTETVSIEPTETPVVDPTDVATEAPTVMPTETPIVEPTLEPTPEPTVEAPTKTPMPEPTPEPDPTGDPGEEQTVLRYETRFYVPSRR